MELFQWLASGMVRVNRLRHLSKSWEHINLSFKDAIAGRSNPIKTLRPCGNIYRLNLLLLFAVVALAPVLARASFNPLVVTPLEACNAWISQSSASDGYARSYVSNTAATCTFTGAAWSYVNQTVPIVSGSLCPAYSTPSGSQCSCEAGYTDVVTGNSCDALPSPLEVELASASNPNDQSCPCLFDGVEVGHPILPATGEKTLTQSDYQGAGADALSLVRSYRSGRVLGTVAGIATAGLSQPWSHNHSTVLKRTGTAGATGSAARVLFGDGSGRSFDWQAGSNSWLAANSADTLTSNATGMLYKRLDDDSSWQFDAAGRLLTVIRRNGWINSYTYSTAATPAIVAPSPGLLIAVTNQFGRALSFTYNAAGQLISVKAPDGQLTSYGFDGTSATSRLTTVSYPGNSGGTVSKTYLYENAAFPQLLTGIIDETGTRLATYAYDSQGRGISTQHAGGADLHTISYGSGGTATVTDPLGTQRTYNYGTSKGKLAVTGADKPSGTGARSAASRVQDVNGFITQETDFLGVNTMYTWDINRRLPLSTTQAASLPEARTTTTQWHSSYRLPLLVTEAARTTAYTYDSAGNILTRTETDTASSQSWQTTWTYNAAGQMLTVKGPRTDVDDTTRLAYYSSSTGFYGPNSDASFDSVKLLLHADGASNSTAFVDSSQANKTLTAAGNAKISTTQGKFGGSSLALDGTGDYLTTPNSTDLNFGSGDFTIELWAYPTSTTAAIAAAKRSSAEYGPVQIAIGSAATAYVSMTGSSWTYSVSGGAPVQNAWNHIAMVRSAGSLNIYVNGVGASAIAINGALMVNATAFSIGAASDGAFPFTGYIDDVRVTKDVARYTANFTPPAQAFPHTVPVIDSNAVGHTAGDLQSITNAAGHVTQFTQYDRAGRVRQTVDPKGIVTDTAYTLRGWINSVTVTPPGGVARTTSYTYDNAGQLTGVALPDATTMSYSYDAAQRLTSVTDAKGNSVTYTLDNAGNKLGEQVKDPLGSLQRNITRVYDALNRVQQVTGASN